MYRDLTDISVSVTHAFNSDGTTLPVYWEVRDSGRGEPLYAGVREEEKFCDPNNMVEWGMRSVIIALVTSGMASRDAVKVARWLFDAELIHIFDLELHPSEDSP